jgi:hypothetical protein
MLSYTSELGRDGDVRVAFRLAIMFLYFFHETHRTEYFGSELT